MSKKNLTCEYCGEGFRGLSRRKYCSRSCAAKANWEKRKSEDNSEPEEPKPLTSVLDETAKADIYVVFYKEYVNKWYEIGGEFKERRKIFYYENEVEKLVEKIENEPLSYIQSIVKVKGTKMDYSRELKEATHEDLMYRGYESMLSSIL